LREFVKKNNKFIARFCAGRHTITSKDENGVSLLSVLYVSKSLSSSEINWGPTRKKAYNVHRETPPVNGS